MAIFKKSELKNFDEKTIKNKLEELKKELMRINTKIAMKILPENPGKVKEIKKTIAKLNFILKNKKFKEEIKKKV